MFGFIKNIAFLVLLTISYTSMAKELLVLNCEADPRNVEIETTVRVQEKSPEVSSDPFLITVTRNHKSVKAGHMLYHGGLGIDKMGNCEHLYLYTGFDQSQNLLKWKPGILNASEFGIKSLPMLCKKLEGIDQ